MPRINPIIVDCGGDTERAKEWATKLLNPGDVHHVSITKHDGGYAVATFALKGSRTLSLQNAFGVGYRGEGPTALYEILLTLGFEEEANQVFTFGGTELKIKRQN